MKINHLFSLLFYKKKQQHSTSKLANKQVAYLSWLRRWLCLDGLCEEGNCRYSLLKQFQFWRARERHRDAWPEIYNVLWTACTIFRSQIFAHEGTLVRKRRPSGEENHLLLFKDKNIYVNVWKIIFSFWTSAQKWHIHYILIFMVINHHVLLSIMSWGTFHFHATRLWIRQNLLWV